jgi:MFS family permease
MTETPPRSPRRAAPRRPGLVLAALCAADFLVVLDGLVVAVALPAVQHDLGMAPVALQWVVTAYVLTFGGFLLLGGRMGDLHGRRRVLLAGLWLFGAGAALGGLAWSPHVLVAGRAVQGLGAALMTPTALALLVAAFPDGRERVRALGWWSAASSAGVPAGALLGGLLTAALGWRSVLLGNAPAALLAAVAVRCAVAEDREAGAGRRLDVPGAVLVTAGTALVVLALVGTERLASGASAGIAVLLPLAAGIGLLVAFARVERRAPAPLVPPGVLGARGVATANLVGAALPVGLGAVLFLGTLQLQEVLGLTAARTGSAYLALAVPVVVASPLASWLVARLGIRAVAVLGFALQAAGLVVLARAPTDATFLADVLPGFALVGAGAPLAFVPTTAVATVLLGPRTGLASGLFSTSQQLGNAMALALVATVAAGWTRVVADGGAATVHDLAGGYRAGYLAVAALVLLAGLGALRLPVSSPPGRRPGSGEDAPVSRTVTS